MKLSLSEIMFIKYFFIIGLIILLWKYLVYVWMYLWELDVLLLLMVYVYKRRLLNYMVLVYMWECID